MRFNKDEIRKKAEECATKDGRDFNKLDEFWQKVYLHAGETALIAEARPEPAPVPVGAMGPPSPSTEKEPEVAPAEKAVEPPVEKPPAPALAPRPHKHHYRKDGTCACGAVLSATMMKKRELKAKG